MTSNGITTLAKDDVAPEFRDDNGLMDVSDVYLATDFDMRKRFTIRSYDPIWPRQFQAIKADLESDLAEAGVTYESIEHIGSTSVPGLGSKATTDPRSNCWCQAIIDICIVIPRAHFDDDGLAKFKHALLWGSRQGGYFYIGDGGVGELSSRISPDL